MTDHSDTVLTDPDRLAVLRGLDLSGPGVEDAFERLAELVRDTLDVPVALISLVEDHRQHFPGCVGLPEPWATERATPLSHSFCRHVVASDEALVISDSREDPRVEGNPAITEMDVVAYLGIPLRTPDGHVLGSFCAIDHEPREWEEKEIRFMEALSESVIARIELQRELEERRRAEEARGRTERRLEALVQASRDWIWEVDAEARFTFSSPAVSDILGYEPEEVLGRTTFDLMESAEAERFGALVTGFIEDRRPFHDLEKALRRRDGAEVVLSTSGIPLLDEAGALVGYHGISRDITSRKRAEESARRLAREQAARAEAEASERRITSLLEGMVEGFVAVDRDGRFTYVNRGAEVLLGRSRGELLGEIAVETLDWLPGSRLQVEARALQDRPAPGTVRRIEEYFPARKTWVRAEIHTTEEGLVLFLQDVTREKEAEGALEEKERQLRQSQKMEAVGLLAGGIAHDFNNLLTVIGGNAQLALMEEGLDEEVRGELEEIGNASARAAGLTRQLLAFSRKQVSQPRVLDLEEVVIAAERMLSRLVGEHIALSSDLGGDLPPVLVDPGQMEQVVLNLVVNARDAMPEGGRIRITTRAERLERPRDVETGTLPPGSWVVLGLEDEGTGMDPQTLEHIFEPFFTTKEAGRGTGLGLSTVYGIVKQSGGEIDVRSRPGEGTTFEVHLPAADVETVPEDAEDLARGFPVATGRILLVEDEPAVRSFASRALGRAGFRVVEAGSGEEALGIVATQPEPFDLVVTDLVMPGINGQELARRLSEEHPDLPVLFTSGYTDDDIARQGMRTGSPRLLEKPYSASGLASAVEVVLAASG